MYKDMALSNYDWINKIPIKNFRYPITHLKNFSTYRDLSVFYPNSKIEKHVIIKEKAFVIDLIGYSHFHMVFDKIAQYEFIKKYIPEINLYIIGTKQYLNKDNGIIESLKKVYQISDYNVFDIDSGDRFLFEDLYFILPTHNNLFNFEDEWFDPWQHRDDFSFYIKTIYPLLQERFKDYLSPVVYKNKKIFISRFKQHEITGRDPGKPRYISKNDEIILENFFKDMGYKIYSAEDLSFLDQIKLYSESSHIAAIKSSALVNIIFCKPETIILGVNLDDEYQVWYDYICIDAGLNYLELPPMIKDGKPSLSYSLYTLRHTRKDFSVNEILNEIKKSFI
jgi:hypothetical protein